MDYKGMHRQRRFLLIAAGLGVIATFLPWVKMDVGGFLEGLGVNNSVNGFRSIGLLAFIGFVVCGILAFYGAQDKPLDKVPWFVVLVAGVIALSCISIFLVKASNYAELGMGMVQTSIGAGALLALGAALFTLVSAWLFKPNNYTLRDGWEAVTKGKLSLPGTNKTSNSNLTRMEELEKLITMKNEGKITEEEYQRLKAELFSK